MSIDIRDRTHEFHQTVQQLQATQSHTNGTAVATQHTTHNTHTIHNNNNINSNVNSTLNNNDTNSTIYTKTSQFTQAAHSISTSIQYITTQLEQLTVYTKQYSLFNDNTVQINELITLIKSNIAQTQSDLTLLQDFVNSQSGLGGRAAGQHSTAIVNELRTKLADTTKNFTIVLKQRTDNLKVQQNRRQQFDSSSTSQSTIRRRTGMLQQLNDSMEHRDEHDVVKYSSKHSTPTFGLRKRGNAFDSLLQDDTQPLLNGSSTQQQQQQQQVITQDTTNEYLQQRAEAVESIETTITQLSQMYQQLVELVGQQEEVVLRIDNNIDDTLVNVEAGHSELLKYFDSISGSRWLILKVFSVLIVFIIFFMLFVA